jgi:hypothetical protein
MAQELLVQALGMITQPNKMGQYPVGAMSFAQDVFIRAPGIVEASKPAVSLHAISSSAAAPCVVLIPGDAEMVNIYGNSGAGWSAQWFSAATSNVVSIPYTFPGNGLSNYTRSRGRSIVTTTNGPIIFDYATPTTAAQRTPRFVGLPAPVLTTYSSTAGGGNALAINKHCTVIALVKRVFPDGYELVSAMSNPVDAAAGPFTTADIGITLEFGTSSDGFPVQVGDIVEIYRTRSQDAGSAGIGGTSCDATFYLTTTHTVVAGDVIVCNFVDSVPDTGLGRQAYTNPNLGGGEATYVSPPAAPITCTFKGYTFLFNITEPAQAVLQALGGIGYALLADPPAWRQNIVGGRELTGTYAAGSRTITAISAAHMVGIKVGQALNDFTVFPGGQPILVTAIGASTITLSSSGPVAVGSGTKTFVVYDTMTIDGATGSYFPLGAGVNGARLESVQSSARSGLIVGTTFSALVKDDLFQAASLSFFSGIYTCSATPPRFSIAKRRATPLAGALATISLNATNGANYQPALPEYGLTPQLFSPVVTPNGFAWCEEQEPDAWPPANRGHVGSGTVLAAISTPDAIWIACTDGLWRLSGDGGSVGSEGYDWRLDQIDSTLIVSGPQAICVLRDTVYMYTARGFVSVDDANGVNDRLSEGIIGDLLPGVQYSSTASLKVRADEDKDEIWVVTSSAAYVWSYLTKTWVRSFQLRPTSSCTYTYWRVLNALVMADDTVSAARYIDWLAVDPGTVIGVCTYQPIYGGDPFQSKQFIDVTPSFDRSTIPAVAIIFNGITFTGLYVNGNEKTGTDRKLVFGVPRDAPAISQSLAIGLQFYSGDVSNTQPPRLWGLRIRFEPLGEQQTQRDPS